MISPAAPRGQRSKSLRWQGRTLTLPHMDPRDPQPPLGRKHFTSAWQSPQTTTAIQVRPSRPTRRPSPREPRAPIATENLGTARTG